MTTRLFSLLLALLLAGPALAQDAAVPGPAGNWFAGDPADGVEGIRLDAAYDLLGGREPAAEVIVAVIDSGVETTHPDLVPVLWTNPGEIAGDGLDNDGNGYADDVHGWSFLGGPGGNVEHDTLELARLVAACRAGTPYPNTDCDALEQTLESERAVATTQLAQLGPIHAQLSVADSTLRARFGDAYDVDDPLALDVGMDMGAAQMQRMMGALVAQGFTFGDLDGFVRQMRDRLAYAYNPGYDVRHLVGDDPADLDERAYGVPDVDGPDPNHGTGVAGLIAAVRGNDAGIDGIAPNTADGVHVRIMALRAVPGGDERDKDVANAIRYAADNGARIINMSFGKAYSPQKEAVDAAVRYAEERGVLLVHAAGNDGKDLETNDAFPSDLYADGGSAQAWLTVGASGAAAAELAASFSNTGATRVDLFAPGARVETLARRGITNVTDGTSFAAPVVSGVAALLMVYFPDLSAADVRSILLDSARRYADVQVPAPGELEGAAGLVPFSSLSVTGGVVDAAAAVELAIERADG